MEATVRFKGWTPSPRAVVVGMERDNKVFTLRLEGLPVYPGGTAYLHIDLGSAGADSIEIVDGLAEIKRNITQYEGGKNAYVEIIAKNDVVWHSDRMLIYVNPLPLVSGKIEQAYPTAFEQALAQTAADKAAAAKSAADAAATAAGIVTEEAARQDAESKRVAEETARKQAEETRAEHERLRASAEGERVKAENARKTAEANREQAEAEREQEMADALASVAGAENAVQANEQQRVLAERTRAAQEQARQSTEQSRIEAEQAREQAEQRRETAETSRAEAERQRESMETSRQTAETARNAAENGRAKAEKARETAESQRQQAETARADAEGKRVQAEQGRVTAEQGRVKAEVQREEAMAQHAEKIAELESEVAKKAEIDDTTVSGTDAWSSQHIVDMLCPPLEESGNPVVCYPVAGSKLRVTASWEPTQEGSGEPYPAGGGKNLADNALLQNNLGVNINGQLEAASDGRVAINGDINVSGIDTVTLSCGGTAAFIYALLDGDTLIKREASKPNKATIDVSGGNILRVCVYSGVTIADIKYIQVEAGSTATAYAPYANIRPIHGRNSVSIIRKEDELSMTLTLSSTIYGGEVGVDGTGQETWAIANLTQQLPSYVNVPTSYGKSWVSVYWTWSALEGQDGQRDAKTNTFEMYYWNNGLSVEKPTMWYANTFFGLAFPLAEFGLTSEATNEEILAAARAYILALPEPLIIAYKLATPQPFTATGGGTIKALSGTNIILTDADTLTVTGRADPIRIIQQLQAASTASAQALADVERAVTDI